ncbi:bacillithiol biosynthesis cysteine-adding enzyme BshC [Paenibacillus sp. P96]|uniref:Putative cysteine ligase BshC n=1 Tax=Paenibacillus zeirhizosphaerae TaxID=2987519 RepID=A0ABT9FQC6_9BACL|nr:bacillithiol biosynthesis cysteine-adding enzyme BshC [Paenibacillus sp. P96]MDP4096946.1 bacillithiol biosynthesis cysteine-adding enzyme BshC [Paenibacillus sp. P96]
MNIIPETLRAGSALAEDYVQGTDRVLELYGYHFRQTEDYKTRVERLDEMEAQRIDRQAVVHCLRIYNQQHNGHAEVMESLDRLSRSDALVIVGGQQSGLFTGQLLVIYKAATIIKAAHEAEQRLGRPVVPVFWVAGEDHDWDEVNHTYIMNGEPEAVKIKLRVQPERRNSVSYIPLSPAHKEEALLELERLLPDAEYKADVLQQVRTAFMDSQYLSDAFAKMLGQFFGRYGLVLLDSADPELRKLELPVFRRMIESNDELEAAYQMAARQIEDAGYGIQAEVAEGGANLFYINKGERLLLFKQNGVYGDRRGQVRFTKEELLEELERHPERFSNNVLTRPLMQDSLLPVLATVLGHGEISYWAITRKAFEVLGLEMPILQPRMSFTLIEPNVHKHMEGYGLTFQHILDGLEPLKDKWLSAQDSLHMEEEFAALRQELFQLYEPVIERAGRIEKGLIPLGEKNRDKIAEQLDFMEARVRAALVRKHETALRQWDLMGISLLPLGRPQERVYSIYQYTSRYGEGLVHGIMNLSLDWEHIHRTIYL